MSVPRLICRIISSAVARLHEGMYGVYSRCCSLCYTAYHGSAAPTGPWRRTIAVLGEQMIWIYLEILAANLLITFVFGDHRGYWYYTSIGLLPRARRRGASGGGRRGGVPAERIPRDKPPDSSGSPNVIFL